MTSVLVLTASTVLSLLLIITEVCRALLALLHLSDHQSLIEHLEATQATGRAEISVNGEAAVPRSAGNIVMCSVS
jgi:hypothetical protein